MANISIDRTLPKPQEFASDGTDAIGFTQFWGNSPALDLLGPDPQAAAFGPAAAAVQQGGINQEKKDAKANEQNSGVYEDAGDDEGCKDPEPAPLPKGSEPINILITAGADIRHVVKTLAKLHYKEKHRLRFFIHENKHEVLARHLLFLQIINNRALPVRERMEVFLSLYGNTLVRERDCTYVSDIAPEFVELITDNSSHPLAEVVDLTQLKFKDRDILQDVFKGWYKDVPFDIEALRDQRCRGYYRERYEYRKNMMDYDYQTFIKEVAGIINWFHYKAFGHTGVAFETRLASYGTPNRSLASYTEAVDRTKGTTVQVRGFWGDIVNSPYHAFCTTTDAEARPRLFKVSNQQYRHTETDIAEYNLTAYLSEMETGECFTLPPEKPEEHEFPYASPLDELRAVDKVVEVNEEEETRKEEEAADAKKAAKGRRAAKKVNWPPLMPAMEGVEVILLAGEAKEVLKKPKYKGLFHRAFVGTMGCMPFFEEMGLNSAGQDPFRDGATARIRRPPSQDAPDAFGKKREESFMAGIMAPGAEVVFETMKYQAHFDGSTRLGFRHRVAQAGHLAGWRLKDERRSVPRMESDMQERTARAHDRDATDFLRFVTDPGEACAARFQPPARIGGDAGS
eukprot:TRINITY_DN93537_c0_g1_i1.p1 TRINITY_DN93537_c0_g1~~TRINITY_DN93537_c0_g1_i1.p1  ORF type:complete len:626 (-),score=153.80 TRINITY_DN93537_c0_g1_i1:89-1966(-)